MYVKKESKTLYQFVKMESENGKFKVVDLHGNEQVLEFPHAELKLFRSTDKSTPTKLGEELVKKLQMEKSDVFKLELEKAQLQAGVLSTYLEILVCIVFVVRKMSETMHVCEVCLSQERMPGHFIAGLHH